MPDRQAIFVNALEQKRLFCPEFLYTVVYSSRYKTKAPGSNMLSGAKIGHFLCAIKGNHLKYLVGTDYQSLTNVQLDSPCRRSVDYYEKKSTITIC